MALTLTLILHDFHLSTWQNGSLSKTRCKITCAQTDTRLITLYRYPRLTLILQSLASLVIGYEAISKLVPDVYFGEYILSSARYNALTDSIKIPWVMHLHILLSITLQRSRLQHILTTLPSVQIWWIVSTNVKLLTTMKPDLPPVLSGLLANSCKNEY